MLKVNLGCGHAFVDSPEWLNFDFSPVSPSINKCNLLGKLPVENQSASIVYSSHFLEHIPRAMVPSFLGECHRILKPDGVLRLVLPDLENIVREYLSRRESGDHEKANFVVLELIDQCVRTKSGGELGMLYSKMKKYDPEIDSTMIAYIRERTGENLFVSNPENELGHIFSDRHRILAVLKSRISHYWIRLCLLLLPSPFRIQNISFAGIGERHHWLWDFHQLKTELESVGFTDVQRQSASSSMIINFPFQFLDVDTNGLPRKGNESMYIEASKKTLLSC